MRQRDEVVEGRLRVRMSRVSKVMIGLEAKRKVMQSFLIGVAIEDDGSFEDSHDSISLLLLQVMGLVLLPPLVPALANKAGKQLCAHSTFHR